MDLLKLANGDLPPRSASANPPFLQFNSNSAFLSVNCLNAKHPSSMKPSTSEDCEMSDESSNNKGLTTTVLYSPLHIDADSGFRPKSPTLQVQCDGETPQDPPERGIFCRTPPLICEQGPSAPSSPTSPGGRRKPNSLYVDGLQRLDLLSPNFVPSMDFNKLSPLSPSYPTSDLGSSPRSSISITQSGLGPHWTSFRDFKKSSSDYDGDSDICPKDLLSPGTILSPAPFSPFSDESETPYSQRSPNMSPMPTRHLHFSFDQIRSRSSMSNRADTINHDLLMPQMSLDIDSRERSRSEGEMNNSERMDTTINHSTISVPVTSNRVPSPRPGHYRKRLLQQCLEDHENLKHFQQSSDSITTVDSGKQNPLSSVDQEENDLMNASVSTQVSRQPTIEEPPPEPTFAELFNAADLGRERQRQVEEWLKQQAAALEILRNSLVPMQQDSSNLLKVPSVGVVNPAMLAPPQTDMRELAKMLAEGTAQQRQSLFRRSHSETDVSGVASQSVQEQSFVCEHCGQAFAMHDRLAKHIASRHRDRSASVNDENSKTHKCTMCSKSFGRSDMLTRHMRLHTGVKPYSCLICGQVFSRSDHLSTHQRTHTGEKPYRCPQCCYSASRRDMITRHMRTHLRPDGSPLPSGTDQLQLNIGQLSLNSRSPLLTPEPQPNTAAPQFPTSSQTNQLGNSNSIFAQQLQVPKLVPQATISNDSTDAAVFAAAAAAAQNAALSTLYNNAQQQMKLAQMGRSLDAQLQPDFMCRSTPNIPNLLGTTATDRASAFKPLTPTTLTPQSSSNNLAAAAAAAFAQKLTPFIVQSSSPQATTSAAMIQQLAVAVQAQQQAQIQAAGNLLAPPGLGLSLNSLTTSSSSNPPTGNPMLARQSSIGGFGFS